MDNDKPTNTNPAVKATSTQAVNSVLAEPVKPKKSNQTLLIILVILLIAALATGGIFAYLYFSNGTQSSTDNQTSTSEVVIDTEEESDNNATSVSLAQAESLLRNKYELDSLATVFIDGWPKYIENLDQTNKILFTIYQVQRDNKFSPEHYVDNVPAIVKNIAFDDFNDAYVYYFGDTEPLEKKDYKLDSVISKIVYRSEDDSFDVYFPDGIGGYSTTRMLSKVDNVVVTKDGFKATILAVTLDSNVRQNVEESLGKSGDGTNWFYEILMTDETLEEIRDSLSAYEFNFTNEAGEYKLVSINKI